MQLANISLLVVFAVVLHGQTTSLYERKVQWAFLQNTKLICSLLSAPPTSLQTLPPQIFGKSHKNASDSKSSSTRHRIIFSPTCVHGSRLNKVMQPVHNV